MTSKKIIVLAILVVSLFAVSAVSGADNQTDNIVSTDLTANDVASADAFQSEYVTYNGDNVTNGREVLAVSDSNDEISRNNDEESLSYSYTYPYYYSYNVDVDDVFIAYGDSGSITMQIDSASSDYKYRYYFYLKVYDSYGSSVISKSYSSTYTSSSRSYSLSSSQLSPGTYTIKIVNNYDSEVMDTATLTVGEITHDYPHYYDYSVSVDDASIVYGEGGYIYMNINPSVSSSYRYYYYLRVYDSNGNQKLSYPYYSSSSSSSSISESYYLSSYDLSPGSYTVKIENYDDGEVMDTATLTVGEITHDYPYYYDYSVSVDDTSIVYGESGYIYMDINPSASSTYRYYYYLRVYDSNGNQKISNIYYGTYASTSDYYYLNSYDLDPGVYTIKIENYADNEVMDTAKLTIKSNYPYYNHYNVTVQDTSVNYGDSGSITMDIIPSEVSIYKYYFYLRVYDLNGNRKFSQSYYSSSSSTDPISKSYYLSSYDLSPGSYTVKIENYYDGGIMATATLAIENNVNLSYYSYNGLKNKISDVYTGSTINLNEDLLFDENAYSPISISKTLTIDGHNHVIDANDYTRIFSISGDNVVLKNIIFKNANYSSSGGAIYWTGGNGKLINCTFIDNGVSDYNGGAVYWTGSYGNMTGCKFINNKGYNGGAVYWSGSSGKIANCDFTSNVADYQGGAVYLNTYSTISNSNFKSNAAEYGGAIAVGSSYYSSDVINSSFNNNVADYGSAIKWQSSLGTVTNCTFNGAKTNSHKYMYISEKRYPYFDVNVENITLGEKLNLTISWSSDLQGDMTIDIFSQRMNKTVYNSVKLLDGTFNDLNILIPNLKSGDCIIDVTYSGDNIFENRTITDYFTVIGKESDITFTVQNVTWGTAIVLNPTVTAGATGLIEILVNDEYVDLFEVGTKYSLYNVGGPSSKITLVYLGDDNYMSSQYSQTAYVERLYTSISIPEKFVSGYSTFPIIFNEDATGYVDVSFAGQFCSDNLENGTFTFDTYERVSAGTHELHIKYYGDGKYYPLDEYYSVDVEIQNPTIEFNVPNIPEGYGVTIEPYIRGATGTYSIYVDGKFKTRINVGDSYTITGQDLGKHDVNVTYSGDDYYNRSYKLKSFRVYKFYPIKVKDTQIIYNTNEYLQAKLYDEFGEVLANKPVFFKVNGIPGSGFTDENGTFLLNMELDMGVYDVEINNIYVNETKCVQLTIFTSIQSENMTRYYNSGYDFNATFFDISAKPLTNNNVLFEINGNMFYTTTDENGQAKLVVPLPIGEYVIKTTNINTDEEAINKLTIVTSIDCDDMSRAYNSTMDYKATFYDVNGTLLTNQTVTFEIGARKYYVVTDMSGQAILNVGLAKGEYNITSVNPSTNQRSTNKLIILERIINNNDVVVLGNEETYYSVRVIDNDAVVCKSGETVEFRLNGKTYDIKTGSDGYARLKISEAGGIHTVTAKYKGYSVENLITVLADNPSIFNVSASNINYGEKETITTNIGSQYLNGNVTINVTGSNGYSNVFTQKASQSIVKELDNLDASTYQVTVTYSDFDNFYYSKVTKSFKVSKATPDVIVTTEGAKYGENSTITVNIQKAGGNVTIKVGDKTFKESVVKNGVIIKKISDLASGNYTVSVVYEGNNNFNKVSKSASLEVARCPVVFTLDVSNCNYGQNVVAKVYSNVAGKITVKIGSATKTVDATAGKQVSVNFGKLNVGKYTVNADFAPTDKSYETVKATTSMEVIKVPVVFTLKVGNSKYGQNVVAKVYSNIPGKATVKIGSTTKTVNLTGGNETSINFAKLNVGKYAVNAEFNSGDKNYDIVKANASIEVVRVPVSFTLNVTNSNYGQDVVAKVKSSVAGKATVKIGSTTKTVNVTAGNEASVNFGKLNAGKYSVNADIAPSDKNYQGVKANASIEIKKLAVSVNVKAENIELGQATRIAVTITNGVSGSIKLQLNNKTHTQAIKDSKAIFNVTDLAAGKYTVKAIFDGNTNYNPASKSATFEVKGVTISNLIIPSAVSNNDYKYSLDLPQDADGNLTVTINGKNYTSKAANGQATVSLPKMADGNYKYTVKYSGDSKYEEFTKTNTVKVAKVTVKSGDANIAYGSGYDYKTTFTNNDGTPLANAEVSFVINGKIFKVKTDSKGVAILNVGLGNGVYEIASINPKTGETTYNTLTVIGGTNATILSASNVSTVYNGGKFITIGLKDVFDRPMANVPISVNITGTPTIVVTDSNGQAKVSTNGLTPKTYYANVTFAGNNKFTNSSAVAKVVVKKAKVKISAGKKTFKLGLKTKKYTVTMKNNKNKVMKKVKLKIKVGGKTYTAKTNSKGKATFKITKLNKKGKFKAVVKYSGNKNYKALSKKVVITVK